MTKEEIGNILSALRQHKKLEIDMNEYAIQSIETARSSYPVSNLIKLCEALQITFCIKDSLTEEVYPIYTIESCHELIKFLMDRYDTDEKIVYRLTGVHYSLPKKNDLHLSINTLLAICQTLCCDLFVITSK